MSGQRQPKIQIRMGVEVPVRGTMIGGLVSTSSAGSATHGVVGMSDTLALSFQASAPARRKAYEHRLRLFVFSS
jgi:hypothetical protein